MDKLGWPAVVGIAAWKGHNLHVTIPSGNDEWTIHSINIHGLFFERWCEHAAAASTSWRTTAVRLPVEFPPANGPLRGKEGEADLWLEADSGPNRINLVVECKKNNPDFIDWVFFRKSRQAARTQFIVGQLENESCAQPMTGWRTVSSLRPLASLGSTADDGRETRGEYSNVKNEKQKTKTANASIADAAYQVALSTKAIVSEQQRFSDARGRHSAPGAPPWRASVFCPVIITTAHLFMCTFDPADVSPERGDLALSKASLEPVDEVVYEYALPRHLQSTPADLGAVAEDALEAFWRMHIIVVRSTHLTSFLGSALDRLGAVWPQSQA